MVGSYVRSSGRDGGQMIIDKFFLTGYNKKSLRTCALQRKMPNSGSVYILHDAYLLSLNLMPPLVQCFGIFWWGGGGRGMTWQSCCTEQLKRDWKQHHGLKPGPTLTIHHKRVFIEVWFIRLLWDISDVGVEYHKIFEKNIGRLVKQALCVSQGKR
jgi:hypothetical protein